MEAVVYCRDPAHVRVFPGVSEALIKLREAGFLICIVTNQSGIGQGLLTEKDFHRVQAELLRQLAPARVDAVYFCPDHPNDPSPRRKPGIGMLLEAARDLSIELSESYFVGDRDIDMECGRKAGTHTVLVETGYGRETVCRAEFRAPSMVEAAELIVKLAR